MEEIWKTLEENDNYMISNLGRLKSIDRVIYNSNGKKMQLKGKIIKAGLSTSGYLQYHLHSNNKIKSYFAHRLVAKYFVPNPLFKKEVNHLDENKTNNVYTNLEWATSKENANYGTRNARCLAKVMGKCAKKIAQYELNGDFVREWNSIIEAARFYNIDPSNIIRVCKGRRPQTAGYKWEYLTR